MEKWKNYRLGDICDVSSSKRIYSSEYCKSGVPFYRGKEIIEKHFNNAVSTELYISRSRYNEIKRKFAVPQISDILLTSVGTLGIPWLVDETEFYFKDGNLTWLKAKQNKISSKFLYLWLNSPQAQHQIDMMSIGSTQKALTIETLNKFCIFLPSLEIQEKVCSVFYSVLDKIKVNRRINTNLEQQAQAIFKEMFIDNGLKNVKKGMLQDIAEITMGLSPDGSSYNEKQLGIIFFQGRAEFSDRFPKIRLYTSQPKRMAMRNDILMSVRAPVGDINIAHHDCCIGRGLASIRSKYNHQSFLFYTMLNLKKYLDRFNSEGTVFGAISKDALNTIPIDIPSEGKIKHFEQIASPIDTCILNNYKEICCLESLRDTLLPKLMSGEIDVSKIELD